MSNTANKSKYSLLQKLICLALAVVLGAIAGVGFHDQRTFRETVVVSDALTEVRMLSDYLPSLKGTYGDTPIFVFDSGVPGGSVLYCGGTHPYEPATSVSAYVLMENIQVEKGIVYVIPQTSFSATTMGVQGNAYPAQMKVDTEWGVVRYKIGERNTNPLDQWPDPFSYIHYPSRQQQAYSDQRNLNRAYPGRKDGPLTERVCFAVMEFIRTEQIDMSIDCHEASIMYPVVNTYVSHQRADDIAMFAAMYLSSGALPYSFDMKIESSPKSLKGFTHREWGDYTEPQNWPADSAAPLDPNWPGTLAILMETAEPFIDRIVGPMTNSLMVDGHDLFLSFAGNKNLTYAPYNEANDWSHPIETRVGRHLSGAYEAINQMNNMLMRDDMTVIYTAPQYNELCEKGVGAFLHNPETADQKYVFQVSCFEEEVFEIAGTSWRG